MGQFHGVNINCETYCSVFQVDFVTNDDKRKVFWVTGTGLDKELISPAVQGLECVWNGHIVDKNTAVCSSVERDS